MCRSPALWRLCLGLVFPIALSLFYYDQRIRKEGFDIEYMMQASSMEQAGEGGSAAPGGNAAGVGASLPMEEAGA